MRSRTDSLDNRKVELKSGVPANELVLSIDGLTPASIPMNRLAKYLEVYSLMLGNDPYIHFTAVRDGSCAIHAYAEEAAVPRIKERLSRLQEEIAPRQASKARQDLDDLLFADNAEGEITAYGQKVLTFPGRNRRTVEEIGPIERDHTIEGQIFQMGGKDATINVLLRDGDRELRCVVPIELARRLAVHLFGPKVRLEGTGVWYRVDGQWQMRSFEAVDFFKLEDESLRDALANVRATLPAIPAAGFIDSLEELRRE